MEFKGHKKKQRKALCLWGVGTQGTRIFSEPFVVRFKSYMDHCDLRGRRQPSLICM